MSGAVPSLRLVRDRAEPEHSAGTVLQQVTDLQGEIAALQNEITALRQRDDSLRFYMNRIDEEMRLAAKLQQDFLPKQLPSIGSVRFHTLFRPAGYVSGDLYDVMRLDERHVGFFMCDAVGHGMPAALLTMFIKRALVTKEIFAGGGYRLLEPAETMSRLNQALIEQNLSQATYATAIYGIVDTMTLEVRLARGGHPSPVIIRPDGSMEFVNASGALLGIFPDEQFDQASATLRTGERLMIYSDGIEVAFCGEDMTDTKRWQREVALRAGLTGPNFLNELAAAIDWQAGSISPKDDLTAIVMEVR